MLYDKENTRLLATDSIQKQEIIQKCVGVLFVIVVVIVIGLIIWGITKLF